MIICEWVHVSGDGVHVHVSGVSGSGGGVGGVSGVGGVGGVCACVWN